jgi:sulfur-oxidizing protein SoxX
MKRPAVATLLALSAAATGAAPAGSGAGDAMPTPLAATAADAARGRALLADRQASLCLLCHSGPVAEVRQQGNLAPDLRGVGARLSAAQIRLRLVDPARLNPDTIMPAYLRTEGLTRVAPAWRGKPLLTAEQIEDVVAYLATLKD